MKAFCALSCLLYLSTFSTPAVSASYDCKKAVSNVEHLICNTDHLSKLDIDMANLYRQKLKKDPAVKFEQRTWLKSIRNQCSTAPCLLSAYKARVSALTDTTSHKKLLDTSENNASDLLATEAKIRAKEIEYARAAAEAQILATEIKAREKLNAKRIADEEAENQSRTSDTVAASPTRKLSPNDWSSSDRIDRFDDVRHLSYGTIETLSNIISLGFYCRLDGDYHDYGLGLDTATNGKQHIVKLLELRVDDNQIIAIENNEYGEENLEHGKGNGYIWTFYRANSTRKRALISEISSQFQSGSMLLIRITDEDGNKHVGEYSLTGFSGGYDDYKRNCQY